MSNRGGAKGDAWGGGGSKGAGGARGAPLMASLTQQFSGLAVDGSSLTMDKEISVPKKPPMPGNKLDSKALHTILKGLQAPGFHVAEFPLRKAFATASTTVYTNHFAIELDPSIPLYEYRFTGLPEKMGNRTKRTLVQAMIDNIPFLTAHQDRFVTDYKETLISWIEIDGEALGPAIVRNATENREGLQISLTTYGVVNTRLLTGYAEGKVVPTADIDKEVRLVERALNMVVSTALSRGSFSLKANKFFITGGHNNLSHSLCAIRGYYYSIRPGMGKVLLNLNACTSAFYRPILVSDFLRDSQTFSVFGDRKAQLRGLRVHLTYEPVYNGKTRSRARMIEARIKSICGTGQPVDRQTFVLEGRDGAPDTELTIQQHFERTYNIKVQDPNMPAINCGTDGNPKWYLPENLQILPYQLYKRKVPEHLTSIMLGLACYPPNVSRALIEHEGLTQLSLTPGAGLAAFIDSRMLQVPAATLPYPKPKYGNGAVDMRSYNWNLANRRLLLTNTKTLFKAFIIAVPQPGAKVSVLRDPKTLKHTWDEFHRASQMTYGTATFQLNGHVIKPDFLVEACDAMNRAKSSDANFVMLLLERKSTQAYSIFKDLADRAYGMHALCVVYNEKNHSSRQYWGNIAMKANLKAGGINHTVDGVEQVMKDTLVLGADVTHPGQQSLAGTPSIAAIVGSVSQTGGKFLGSMRLQPHEKACEDIRDVYSMVLERIQAWYLNNGRTLPRNILYYRDGVSDSQYSQVKNNELPQIRNAFLAAAKIVKLPTPPKCRLTAVVVAKRHYVRFFPQSTEAMPNGNCKPGTLVDTAVSSPYFQDYYLQSHHGLKGTAKPAHYFLLVNEMGLTEIALQTFTHKLCYTYVRATLGVSYAPPAYYADRLCERGRAYLRNFLTPQADTEFTDGHKKMKNDIIEKTRKARYDKLNSLRTEKVVRGRIVYEKSAAERKQEEVDDEHVEKEVKRRTFEMAKKTFYGGPVERNPWHSAIANTMFWM